MEKIVTEVADTAEYAVDDIASGEMKKEEGEFIVEQAIAEAITAIEKLIDEKYILKSEVKKSVEEIDKALKGENNQ